jgi:hypothetical protein
MTFKAHKEFFDASVFLGMHSADDGVRKACKRFFALRFRGVALTSLDQVGKCDDVIWRYPRHLPQPDNFRASPVAAGGNLYLASESGVITVIKLGEKFEVVAANTLADQMFVASPAVAEGEMFLRSKTHLFCVSDGRTK